MPAKPRSRPAANAAEPESSTKTRLPDRGRVTGGIFGNQSIGGVAFFSSPKAGLIIQQVRDALDQALNRHLWANIIRSESAS